MCVNDIISNPYSKDSMEDNAYYTPLQADNLYERINEGAKWMIDYLHTLSMDTKYTRTGNGLSL